jgi:tetratricopeptide (TPR) repeat protein
MTRSRSGKELLENSAAPDGETDSIDSRLSRGNSFVLDGSPEEAISIFSSILEADPGNAEAYLGLGLCWGRALLENIPVLEFWGHEIDEEEMLERAMNYLERALEIDPEKTVGYNALARLLVIRGQEEEAVEMFRQSLLIDPAQLEVLEELREVTGQPVWEILDKETDMGEFEE